MLDCVIAFKANTELCETSQRSGRSVLGPIYIHAYNPPNLPLSKRERGHPEKRGENQVDWASTGSQRLYVFLGTILTAYRCKVKRPEQLSPQRRSYIQLQQLDFFFFCHSLCKQEAAHGKLSVNMNVCFLTHSFDWETPALEPWQDLMAYTCQFVAVRTPQDSAPRPLASQVTGTGLIGSPSHSLTQLFLENDCTGQPLCAALMMMSFWREALDRSCAVLHQQAKTLSESLVLPSPHSQNTSVVRQGLGLQSLPLFLCTPKCIIFSVWGEQYLCLYRMHVCRENMGSVEETSERTQETCHQKNKQHNQKIGVQN